MTTSRPTSPLLAADARTEDYLSSPSSSYVNAHNTPAAVSETLAARLERGASVNARFGIALDDKCLVVVAPDIPGLTDDAVYSPVTSLGMLAEVQPLVITSTAVSAALILDMHGVGVAEYLAQNLRRGLPLLLVSADGHVARFVRLHAADEFTDSIDDAARHFSTFSTVREQSDVYLMSLYDLASDLTALLSDRLAETGQYMPVHVRCVLDDKHLSLLGDSTLDALLTLRHRAPSVIDVLARS